MRIGAKLDRQGVCFGWVLVLGVALLGLAACGGSGSGAEEGHATPAHVTSLGGTVYGGRQPIAGSAVILYAAGLNAGDGATEIARTTTNAGGTFNVTTFTSTPADGQLIYVVVQGGDAGGGGSNDAIGLMTVAGAYGAASFPATVNIDELTTVAATAVLQQQISFPACSTLAGNTGAPTDHCVAIGGDAGLGPRGATLANLVNVVNGQPAAFLGAAANGTPLNLTLRKLNTLADLLASCVNSLGGVPGDGSTCGKLFDATGPATDTLVAAFQIASSPVVNARGAALYSLLGIPLVYGPPVSGAPDNWTVGGQRFSYVANANSNDVSAYLVDTAGGVLKAVPGSPFAAGNSPRAITVDPSGRFAYVANMNDNSVSAYTIDPGTGTLTPVGSYITGLTPASVTVPSGSKFAYVANSGTGENLSAFTINAASGALTPVTSGGAANCYGAPPPSGDPANCFAAGVAPFAVAADPAGSHVFVANFYGNNISAYSIGSDGSLAAVGTAAPAGANPAALVVSPDGRHLYAGNSGGNNISGYSIDSSGALTLLSFGAVSCDTTPPSLTPDPLNCFPSGNRPNALTLSSDGRFAYATNSGGTDVSAYTVDIASGALTPVTVGGAGSCSSVSSPVTPDPANCYATGNSPDAVAVEPGSRYAYVANGSDSNISAYAIDSVSGALTPLSVSSLTATGTTPRSVVVDPSGKFAYTANFDGNSVSSYRLDAVTGALLSAGADVAAGTNAYSVTVTPGGGFAYVANQNVSSVSMYRIDPGSGALEPLSGGVDCSSLASSGNCAIAGYGPTAVTVSPDGRFAYVANLNGGDISAYTITQGGAGAGLLNPVAGSPCFMGPNTTNNCFAAAPASGPASLVVDPSSRFVYAVNLHGGGGGGILAYAINASTGALTPIDSAPLQFVPDGVAVDPSGKFVYTASLSVGEVSVDAITQSGGNAGKLTPVIWSAGVDCTLNTTDPGNCALAGAQSTAVTVDPSGKFVYVANGGGNGSGDGTDISAFTINAADGSLVPVGGSACVNFPSSNNCFPAGNSPFAITVDPSGRYTYVVNQLDGTVQGYTIDGGSGALSALSGASPYAAGTAPIGIAIGP
ncbi:MAG: 6-phosphogluconolactonase, cycloisomerase 2 family [Nevskia sp.]|nr:6-phosphogluconolactonase, cycloisomerase 2 family [Nevskia sp.]